MDPARMGKPKTHGPYKAVPPFRRQIISHPGQIPVIAQAVAEAHGVTLAVVIDTTTNTQYPNTAQYSITPIPQYPNTQYPNTLIPGYHIPQYSNTPKREYHNCSTQFGVVRYPLGPTEIDFGEANGVRHHLKNSIIQ